MKRKWEVYRWMETNVATHPIVSKCSENIHIGNLPWRLALPCDL